MEQNKQNNQQYNRLVAHVRYIGVMHSIHQPASEHPKAEDKANPTSNTPIHQKTHKKKNCFSHLPWRGGSWQLPAWNGMHVARRKGEQAVLWVTRWLALHLVLMQ